MTPSKPGPGTAPPVALDPPPDAIRAMGAQALEWVAGYHETIRQRAVFPRTTARELQERLGEPLPQEGRDFASLLDTFRDVVVANARHNAHPRSLGYVSSPGTAVAALADLFASVLNANLTAWRSGPGPAQLERVTIDWVRQAMGCPEGTDGVFVSGGSIANLAGLAAARTRRCGQAVNAEGQRAHPRPLRVYVSEEGHHSVDKAAALLGIGHANVRRIAVDERFRMDVGDLERRIAEDREAGAEPFCVVASAGTVVTGAVDPLSDVAAVARREGLAMHVDACYGGFARLAPSARPLFDGIADADSIALDPHKWLYLPVDCGCILYRDPGAARAAFGLGADYTRVLETAPGEAFAFWDYTPELSRRFRALKVWMALAHVGARAYRRGHRVQPGLRGPSRRIGGGERGPRAAGAGRPLDRVLPLPAAGLPRARRARARRGGAAELDQRARAARAPARRRLLPLERDGARPIRTAGLRPQLPHDARRHAGAARRRAAGGCRCRVAPRLAETGRACSP